MSEKKNLDNYRWIFVKIWMPYGESHVVEEFIWEMSVLKELVMAKIGMIGLGAMGGPMARNLLKSNHSVKVYDTVSEHINALVVHGASCATSSTVADDVEVVITMLPNGKVVSDVLLGEDGLFNRASKGTLFIDSSTIDVETAKGLAKQAHAAGMMMIDAPVSGGIQGAQAGTLTFMVGGTEREFAKAKPILESIGKSIIHSGVSGTGQAAKACNNMMLGISMIAVSEAFLLGQKLGLDPKKLLEIVSVSSGNCWAVTSCNPVPGLTPGAAANYDYKATFTSALMLKDLKLSQNAAHSVGAGTPLGAAATEIYEQFVDDGDGHLDFSGIIKKIESASTRK